MTLGEGSVVAGVTLSKRLSGDAVTSVWMGNTDDGRKVAVHVADGEALTPEMKATFVAKAAALCEWTQKGGYEGVLRVHAVDAEAFAFVADLWTVGSVADLTALD